MPIRALWGIPVSVALCAMPCDALALDMSAQARGSAISTDGKEPGSSMRLSVNWLASEYQELGEGWRRGWQVGASAESGQHPCLVIGCSAEPALEGTAALTLSHYAYGRWMLGRSPSLNSDVAARSQPFEFDSIGSDRCAALLLQSCSRRRPISLTYTSPTFGWLTSSVQLSAGRGTPTLGLMVDVRVVGGTVMLGVSKSGSNRWTAPIALSIPMSDWRFDAALSFGRTASGNATYQSVGLKKSAWGGEARFAASKLSLSTGAPASRKYSLGLHTPLSFDWGAFLNLVSIDRPGDESRWRGAEIGLNWSLR